LERLRKKVRWPARKKPFTGLDRPMIILARGPLPR
jgi:hypothetical protein